MSGRIVVGIDGSQHSANALEWAVGRARRGGEQIELVNSYSMTYTVDFYGYHGVAAESIHWLTEFSTELLDAAEARVHELAPELICTKTSDLGHAADLLASRSKGADALVVGRRGLGGAASALLGSVSNRLTSQAGCPLVVVGDGDLPASGPIVVGIDDSDFSTNALRYAIAEAEVRRTSVRAVAAYEVPRQGFLADPELGTRMRAAAEAAVSDTINQALGGARGADSASVTVESVVAEGRAADVILGHAEDAQLIVVGTHGKGLVRRILLGSVSRRVLTDADRPVAVIDLPEG